jgi:hypothetical protein
VQVLRRPPQDWPPCQACAEALPRRLATARKRGLLDEAGQVKIARRTGRRRQQALLRSEELLAGWRSPGWVVLADKKRSHRPHPDQPGHVLCGRRLPAGTAVERTQPKPLPCQRCGEVLHRQQEKLGLRTVVITSPAAIDSHDRARQRGTSIWAFRGGLPTLGCGR